MESCKSLNVVSYNVDGVERTLTPGQDFSE